MESILTQLGLQHKVPIFKQKEIDLAQFEQIMKPNVNSAFFRTCIMEDTGITSGQVMQICAKIEEVFPSRFA